MSLGWSSHAKQRTVSAHFPSRGPFGRSLALALALALPLTLVAQSSRFDVTLPAGLHPHQMIK